MNPEAFVIPTLSVLVRHPFSEDRLKAAFFTAMLNTDDRASLDKARVAPSFL